MTFSSTTSRIWGSIDAFDGKGRVASGVWFRLVVFRCEPDDKAILDVVSPRHSGQCCVFERDALEVSGDEEYSESYEEQRCDKVDDFECSAALADEASHGFDED